MARIPFTYEQPPEGLLARAPVEREPGRAAPKRLLGAA